MINNLYDSIKRKGYIAANRVAYWLIISSYIYGEHMEIMKETIAMQL